MAWPTTGWATGSATVNAPIGLNVRSGAGTNYNTLRTLSHGSPLQITGPAVQQGGYHWVPVTVNGQTGWVAGEYLQGTANPATPSPPTQDGSQVPTFPPMQYPNSGAWQSGINPSFPGLGGGTGTAFPYYNPNSGYGGDRDWDTTPAIGGPGGYLDQNPEALYSRFISGMDASDSNFGRWLRSQFGPTYAGYEAAVADNPMMNFAQYLAGLGSRFYQGRWSELTPQQRGESSSQYGGGRVQWMF